MSLDQAINILNDKWFDERARRTRNEQWYAKNFVTWISSLGYHIEITGDEFEDAVAC